MPLIDIVEDTEFVEIRGQHFQNVRDIAVRVIGAHRVVRIVDCTFVNCDLALSIGGNTPSAQVALGAVEVVGCHIEDCAQGMVVLAKHVTIERNRVINTTAGDPIYTKGRRAIIARNHVVGASGANAGIFCKGAERTESSPNADGYGVVICNNIVADIDAPGIYTAAGRAQVLGNLVENATSYGVVMATYLDGEHIAIGNVVADLETPQAGILHWGPPPSYPLVGDGPLNMVLGQFEPIAISGPPT